MSDTPSLFISHTHSDKALADAINELIQGVFGDRVQVAYSTKKEHDGGIPSGDEWFRWISDQVSASSAALVLLTPSSVQKPWLLWEAGAVYGVKLGAQQATSRVAEVPGPGTVSTLEKKVHPVVFRLANRDLPTPFRHLQCIDGEDEDQVSSLLDQLVLETFEKVLHDKADVALATRRITDNVPTYRNAVRRALTYAPMVPTEASVQEWLARIEALRRGRLSELPQLHRWLIIAFGRQASAGADSQSPIDLRLHRALGESYLELEDFDRASEQLELALRLAPRDLFVLRKLGRAYLDGERLKEADRILGMIDELDPDATHKDVEAAALMGRYLSESGKLLPAVEHLREAVAASGHDRYLQNLLGQALLRAGDRGEARRVYEALAAEIEADETRDLWDHATLANAQLVLEDEDSAQQSLRRLARYEPSLSNLRSIEKGLQLIGEQLEYNEASVEAWRRALWSKDA